MDGLGKLVRTLRDKCPNCGTNLQIRTRGSNYVGTHFFTKDEICCSVCGYVLPLTPEKRRMKRNEDTEYDD